METYTFTRDQLISAFNKWNNDFVENRDKYTCHCEQLKNNTVGDGSLEADLLIKFLNEK